ncbi:MAG: wax ester/triacylglycerol synthase family O-acyltransferase [Acidimicrobiales bacterium]
MRSAAADRRSSGDLSPRTGPDAAFLYAERPEWHFHVSALTVLDPSTSDRFSYEAVFDQLARRMHLVPQFRWKLVEAPLHLRLDRPIWVDDPPSTSPTTSTGSPYRVTEANASSASWWAG